MLYEHIQGNDVPLSDQSTFSIVFDPKPQKQVETINIAKEEDRSNNYREKQEKIFSLDCSVSDEFNVHVILDDGIINHEEISSISIEDSTVSSMSSGTTKSDSSALMRHVLTDHSKNENLVDRIPSDMRHDKKRHVLTSHSMILRFAETRQERMLCGQLSSNGNNELSDIFQWAASQYLQDSRKSTTSPCDAMENFTPINPIKIWKPQRQRQRRKQQYPSVKKSAHIERIYI